MGFKRWRLRHLPQSITAKRLVCEQGCTRPTYQSRKHSRSGHSAGLLVWNCLKCTCRLLQSSPKQCGVGGTCWTERRANGSRIDELWNVWKCWEGGRFRIFFTYRWGPTHGRRVDEEVVRTPWSDQWRNNQSGPQKSKNAWRLCREHYVVSDDLKEWYGFPH